MAAIIAVAGMPGSCKSKLMDEFESQGYHKFDDFNKNWGGNLAAAKSLIAKGVNIIVSDIEFCNEPMRKRFNNDIGDKVEWRYFQNDPFRCGCNVLFRRFIEGNPRPWREEIEKIGRLRKVYSPPADAIPIAVDHVVEALSDICRAILP